MNAERPRLLVTRPEGQASKLVSACEALGFAVIHAPCLEIQTTDVSIEQSDLSNFDAVVFTSPNAVVHANRKLSLPWTAIDFVYAIGEATAEALEAYRQTIACNPLPPYNSESFVTLLQQQPVLPDYLLIVKGSGGRGYIEAQLDITATTVKTIDVYQRQCPAPDTTLASKLSTPFDIISVMSNETLDNLIHLATPHLGTLLKHRLIVNSERTRRHAVDNGFTGEILVSPYAGDSGQLEVLSNWQMDNGSITRR